MSRQTDEGDREPLADALDRRVASLERTFFRLGTIATGVGVALAISVGWTWEQIPERARRALENEAVVQAERAAIEAASRATEAASRAEKYARDAEQDFYRTTAAFKPQFSAMVTSGKDKKGPVGPTDIGQFRFCALSEAKTHHRDIGCGCVLAANEKSEWTLTATKERRDNRTCSCRAVCI